MGPGSPAMQRNLFHNGNQCYPASLVESENRKKTSDHTRQEATFQESGGKPWVNGQMCHWQENCNKNEIACHVD